MRIKATIYPHGVEFTMTAESEYEHAMLKFMSSGAYEVSGAFCEESKYGWQPSEPTKATLHLKRPSLAAAGSEEKP